ncbi:serine/threonine protein kinase [Minicystis rosea]|nr:serine/threonine protein kinase [Minicystis rosea]
MKKSSIPQEARLVPGYRLDDRYELLYPYAQGGMATVWLARVQGKHGFEKLVAIKTILSHLAREEGFRAMFLDEASIAARIRHPNVADILDLGEEHDTLYMVLEWINGDAWSKLWNAVHQAGQPFPLDLLLRIGADACAGLHAAHELTDEIGNPLGVVHRDVSPQNILISVAGVTKVIDFGIAKAMDRTSEQTKTGMIKGKAQYAAPEQVRGENADRRVDVWAMGTILYHYLAGKLPFEGKNDLHTLKLLTSGRPPPPLPPQVPPQVAQVVMRALAPLPEQRFQTALDMQRALEAVISTPVTTTDVAAFMVQHLAERIEMRRTDLAEAIAEADERSGKPKGPRQRLGTFPELARPVALDQALGRARAGESSGVPQVSAAAAARIVGDGSAAPAAASPSAAPPALAPAAPRAEEEVPTRTQGAPTIITRSHWALMIVAALVPIGVWSLVAYVAVTGPIGRVKAPAPAASGAPSAH